MTEYDYYPETYDEYHPTQGDRYAQWSGSQRFPSTQSAFARSVNGGRGSVAGLPYDYDDEYSTYGGQNSRYRNRSSSFHGQGYSPSNRSYRGRSLSQNYYPDTTYHRNSGIGGSRMYDQDYYPNQGSYNYSSGMGSLPYSPDGRQYSMSPEYIQYPGSQLHDSRFGHTRSCSYPRYGERYPSQHSHLPVIMSASSKSRSSGTYSSRSYSYSSRSRSSTSSSSLDGYYGNRHASYTTPTLVQPAYGYPTVVPINGGNSGYVVVPAVGQNLQLMNPEPYRGLPGGLLRKLLSPLSPSKWSIKRKKNH